MSFLKNLFGGGGGGDDGAPGAARVLESIEYKGFTVRALEMRVGGEFQLCGEVAKEIDGETKVHKFIRADRLPSADAAKGASTAKGCQLVDEQGDKLFR